MTSFTEQIVNCGYTGPINEERKDSIIRAIVLHATTKRTPMLSQLRQGLDVYNFLKVTEPNPEHCRGLLNCVQTYLIFSSPFCCLLSPKEKLLKIVVRFDHNCFDNMPGHTICFPVVSACTKKMKLPLEIIFHFNMLCSISQNVQYKENRRGPKTDLCGTP
uniref:Uncharacterized protein n=1 Tax=Oryzias latipes TaxID=8090 RepID=A0A3B3INW5_ORYLA